MLIAEADFPFLEFLWAMIVFFAWVAWIWIVITVFIDLFRRHDIGGWGKAGWVVFVIVIPFLGVLVYLIAQHDGLRDRLEHATRGGSASEIAKGKELLDSGAITQAEFDSIKTTALS